MPSPPWFPRLLSQAERRCEMLLSLYDAADLGRIYECLGEWWPQEFLAMSDSDHNLALTFCEMEQNARAKQLVALPEREAFLLLLRARWVALLAAKRLWIAADAACWDDQPAQMAFRPLGRIPAQGELMPTEWDLVFWPEPPPWRSRQPQEYEPDDGP